MRHLLALLILITACASAPATSEPGFASVRDRLTRSNTRFLIGARYSSGSMTAQRYTHEGWVEGTTPLRIASGELGAAPAQAGQLALGAFEVHLDPIEIPASVFGTAAQLKDVRLTLDGVATQQHATWIDDNDATVTAMVNLDLSGAISVGGGGALALGTVHLPPMAIDLLFTGSGQHVDAIATLHAMGALWSWAGLLELTELQLSLAAATIY